MTPDPYAGSANPRNPQSWNRYAYVNGDPVNWTDRTGLSSDLFYEPVQVTPGDEFDYGGSIYDGTGVVLDPSFLILYSMFFQPGAGGGGGGQGGGAASALQCSFTSAPGTVIGSAGTADYYYQGNAGWQVQVNLNFTVTGGTAPYTWTIGQYVLDIEYQNGTLGQVLTSAETLPNTATNTNGPVANFYDGPAYFLPPNAPPGRYNAEYIFEDFVTVSSGGQTVNCPTILWIASFNVSVPNGGEPVGTATATLP
jgi:hypothetical protein